MTANGDVSWRMLTAEQREREYNPSSMTGDDYQPFLQAYAAQSAGARAYCTQVSCYKYGSRASQTLDLAMPGICGLAAPPPLLVFVHGGYWQELSKQESFFAAAACIDNGIAYAAIDYSLAPHADLDEIVWECREAFAWIQENASRLGYDGNRIFVAGSSAGAHLAAMMGLRPSHPGTGRGETRLVAAAPAGLVLVSGIYELEPLIGTSVNDALGLDDAAARRNSPLFRSLGGFPPTVVCWGERETVEFKRQSAAFAIRLRDAGVQVHAFQVDGKNHFDIILDLARPPTRLGREVIQFILAGRLDHAVI